MSALPSAGCMGASSTSTDVRYVRVAFCVVTIMLPHVPPGQNAAIVAAFSTLSNMSNQLFADHKVNGGETQEVVAGLYQLIRANHGQAQSFCSFQS